MGVNIPTGDMVQQQHRGNWKTVVLMNALAKGAGEDGQSASEDVSLYTYKTLEITTSASCTVYYQTSWDDTNWFDPLLPPNGTDDVTDVTETYDISGEKRSIEITRACRYIRVWVHYTAAATASVVLTAQM